MNHYSARRISLHMRMSCIHDAKVRARIIVRHRRSFYEKPPSAAPTCEEGREDFRSFATQVVFSDTRIQASAGFLRRVGGLSLLSFESTFNTMKKKKKKKKRGKKTFGLARIRYRSQIADASGFRMRGIAHDDLRLIGHVTKLFRRTAFLFFSFSPVPPTVAA